MQNNAIDIEGNRTASGKLKIKEKCFDKKKLSEDNASSQSSTYRISQYHRFNEIINMIKALSNKITRLDIENKVVFPSPHNVP
jgi:beta-glucosidase/6-phospho-beta-glucosidase/beta-galactosidase